MSRIRSVGRVRFIGPAVAKDAAIEDKVETELFAIRGAFVPSVRIGDTRWMVRGRPATVDDLPEARRILEDYVWSRPGIDNTSWKYHLIAHLMIVYPSRMLNEMVRNLNDIGHQVMIHGDATASNLIRVPGVGLRWIDPLWRIYIPGSPLVDIGKMLQSCYGYEDVLRGGDVRFRPDIANKILNGLSDASVRDAWTWFYIHLARLLRYHTTDVSSKFQILLQARCPLDAEFAA